MRKTDGAEQTGTRDGVMMEVRRRKRPGARLEEDRLEERYAELSGQLARIGFICTGSVMSLYRKCGKTDCGCKENPEMQHGPYHIWTRKDKGKTVTRSLTNEQAKRCADYAGNYRKLKALVEEMKRISIRIIEGERWRER